MKAEAPIASPAARLESERLTLRFSELPALFALVEQLRRDIEAVYALLQPSEGSAPRGAA